MFDLENAILEWRKEMISGGIKSPALLDELESHLRDEIAEQSRRGTEVEEAFGRAAQGIGRVEVLRKEFKKISTLSRIFRGAARRSLRFAGVPNHYIDNAMNDSSINPESRWVTYLRSAAFLLPAICLWMLSSVYVVPQFKSILERTGVGNVDWFVHATRVNFGLMDLFKDHLFWIICTVVPLLGLLEWRSSRWPRFRGAVFGTGVFLLNLAVLLSFFIMFIAATLAMATLAQHAK